MALPVVLDELRSPAVDEMEDRLEPEVGPDGAGNAIHLVEAQLVGFTLQPSSPLGDLSDGLRQLGGLLARGGEPLLVGTFE